MTEFDFNLTPGSIKRAMGDAGAKSRDLWQVPVESIRLIPGFNVREDNPENRAHIQEIGQSILQEGFKQHKPLAGYVAKEGDENVLYIFDGHCRLQGAMWAISQGAEIATLPVVVSQAGTNLEDLTVELIQSNQGKALSSLEKSAVCKRLAGYGWEPAKIGQRLGFTAPYVSDLLLLAGSPRAVREMVSLGLVSATAAIEYVKKYGDKAVEMLTKAQQSAEEQGKTRVTARPKCPFETYAKKNAVILADLCLRAEFLELSDLEQDVLDSLSDLSEAREKKA